MIRKAVKRAAVWTVGAGLVAAPMTVMGPQLSLVACQNPGGEYPRGVATAPGLRLDNSMGRFGDPNTATSKVTSSEGTPEGVVNFFVNGERFASRQLDNDGTVSAPLPRGLRARDTHTVQARFNSECPWNNSRSPRRNYTVYRANTATDPSVGNASEARFSSSANRKGDGDGLDPRGGKMRFSVRREGSKRVIRSKTVDMSNGSAAVNMRDLREGSYVVRSRYLGASNFRPSGGGEAFQVS